jgi:hypothetical protein
MGITTGGWRGVGSVRPTKERIGIILTTITIAKAGDGMKATGIVRTTTGIANTTVTKTTTIIEATIIERQSLIMSD